MNGRRLPLYAPDLPRFESVADRLREVLSSGRVSEFGPYTLEFERAVGRYLGVPALSVSSGTQGLLFALQALGVGRGAKVVLPSFAGAATAQAVVYAGGRPLFADIGEDLTLDSLDLATLLDQNADATFVLPVHIHGLPCDTEAIDRVVESYSNARRTIRTVYDAAGALGAQQHDQAVGGFGDAEVFSLAPSASLTAVAGGIVSSRSADLLERIRPMRNHGMGAGSEATGPGLDGRLSELHAIIGIANLEGFEQRLERRQIIARGYAARIQAHTDFRLVRWAAEVRPAFSCFTVLMPDALGLRREQVMARLQELGVETAGVFPPLHEQRAFRSYTDRPLPRTEGLARKALALPFYTRMTEDDMDHVVEALQRVRKEFS